MKAVILTTLLTLAACVSSPAPPAVTTSPTATPVRGCAGPTLAATLNRIALIFKIRPKPLGAVQAQLFVSALNRSPPVTGYKANTVYLIGSADGRAMVILGYRGCVTQVLRTTIPTALLWLKGSVPGGSET